MLKSQLKESPQQTSQTPGGEDDFTRRVRNELAEEGINFDDLMNGPKTLKLTHEVEKLERLLSSLSSKEGLEAQKLTTELAATREELKKIRTQVMQPALKQVFLVQAILTAIAGGLLSADQIPTVSVPIVGQALGFWTVWLFTLPALRARKGIARWEKSALNIAFLTTPLCNVLLPTITKNCGLIWIIDISVVLFSYAFYLQKSLKADDPLSATEQGKVRGILKYLDWGSWR